MSRRTLWIGLAAMVAGSAFFVTTSHAQAPDERDFRRQVHTATAKGKSFLLASLERKRRRSHDQFERAYPMGFRSLMAYALLEAGVAPDGPEMEKLFGELAKMKLARTYSVSLYAMALDARARARSVAAPSPEGSTKVGADAMSRKERKRLVACIEWLVTAKWPERGTWGYERWQGEDGKWEDYSNTQFAVLALEVGRRRGIEVPSTVFEEVLVTFADNGWPTATPKSLLGEGPGWWGAADEVATAGSTGVASPVTVSDAGFRLRGEPYMWGYRPGFGGPGARGQFSMVAAATSSLMVTRNALHSKLTESKRWDLDRLIASGVIGLHENWKQLVPSPTDSMHRNYYYTLYSAEKALDLGGIVLLGEIDWYREQAVVLMNDQLTVGAWGKADNGREYQEVSTAFALLFLRRATRHLRVEAQGAILTGSGGDSGVEEGRVFVPSLRGTIELREVFESLEDLRTSQYLALAREILQSIPPEQLIDLLPYLAKARNGSRDGVDRFAEESVNRITGLPPRTPNDQVIEWGSNVAEIRKRGKARDESVVPDLVLLLAAEPTTDLMRVEIVRALSRIGSLECVPSLITLVASKHNVVSRRAHEALVGLTAGSIAYTPGLAAEQRSRLSDRWQSLWLEQGDRIRRAHRFEGLRRQLDRAGTPAERKQAADAIVALGESVVPLVDAILAADRFAFDWVLVRHRLTGEMKGL